LDASPFRDADGTLWLYYVTEYGNERGLAPGRIWVDRLLDPAHLADQAVCLVEKHFWQEGPVMLRQRDGRYRLTYSIGAWTNDTYRVVQAVSDRPAGPFVESDHVLMKSTAEVKGPGHHNFFTGPDGEPWLVYHGWDPAMTARYPRMDRLRWRPTAACIRQGPRPPCRNTLGELRRQIMNGIRAIVLGLLFAVARTPRCPVNWWWSSPARGSSRASRIFRGWMPWLKAHTDTGIP
jgi:hypothetical protein